MNDDELTEIFGELPQTQSLKRRSLQSVVRDRRKKQPVHDEDSLHYGVAKLLSASIAPAGMTSGAGVLWFSLESRARRSVWEGARNKRRGCIAGVPDIFIGWNRRAYWIELKTPYGIVSDRQSDLHGELRRVEFPICVARSYADVQAFLLLHGIPHRAMNL